MCPFCDGKIFTLKCITTHVNETGVTNLTWVCDDCKEPMTNSEMMYDFAHLMGKLWSRITKRNE